MNTKSPTSIGHWTPYHPIFLPIWCRIAYYMQYRPILPRTSLVSRPCRNNTKDVAVLDFPRRRSSSVATRNAAESMALWLRAMSHISHGVGLVRGISVPVYPSDDLNAIHDCIYPSVHLHPLPL